ncbi:MCP four helix bundle domain-containing protein [Thiobacter aerophilum]|uniref:MCP four helix bundle domain-containing protein n=1 Tax=Thiobacter aerophilum TaxID=3121275 RepID=A0ABV0EHH7_9BURK
MTDPTHRSFLRWLKLAFIFELVLLAAITLVALLSLHGLRSQVQAIVDDQQARLALIHEMRLAVRERMLRLHMLLMETDPFRRDEYRQQMGEIASRFMQARAEVEARAQDGEERARLAAARALNREVALIVERVLELDEAGQREEARRLTLTQAVPRQAQVLARTDELLRHADADMYRAKRGPEA